MTTQWLRQLSLIAAPASGQDGIELSALQTHFHVVGAVTSAPRTLTARIYNPAPSTINKLQGMPIVPTGGSSGGPGSAAQIVMRAGYEGNFGIIFMGQLMQVKHGREDAVSDYLDIFAADGDFGAHWGVINTSLAAGWTPSDVNDQIALAMQDFGITKTDMPGSIPQPKGPRGKACFGMARDTAYDLGSTTDADWHIRNGRLEWLPTSAYRPGETIKINAQSGMIGIPEQTNFGVSVRTLLNPSIDHGSAIEIDNAALNLAPFTAGYSQTTVNTVLAGNLDGQGRYKVLQVEHFGDTRGNDWYTQCACVALSPGPGGQFITSAGLIDFS